MEENSHRLCGTFHGQNVLDFSRLIFKWIEAEIVTSSSSAATVEKLRRLFATFGLPATVVSDNGSAFVGGRV